MKKYLSLNNYLEIAATNRRVLQRVFFSCIIMIFCYYYYANLFVSQIGLNPILYQEIDPSYWLLMILRIPEFVAGNKTISFVFDLTLFLSAVISFIKPEQVWSVRIFYLFYFLYFMLFNLLAGHHYANVGILVAGFSFLFTDNKFPLLLACSRYYFLFIFTSAALWKLWRGSLFHTEQLVSILQGKNAATIINSDFSLTAQLAFFIGTHPGLAVVCWVFMGVLEFTFVIGFFSYRHDSILLANYLLFFAGGFLIAGIFNIENMLMLITLFPVIKLISKFNKIPIINPAKRTL
jgi:hypothetical protein